MSWQERTLLLLGDEKVKKLNDAHVLVIGLGGVGGFAAEAIARAGVGKMTIVDGDTVDPSNRNRQLIALSSTHEESKAQLFEKRLKDINPDLNLEVINMFMDEQEIEDLLSAAPYDYVVECIDTLTPKLHVIVKSMAKKLPLISSMGAGGKVDPSKARIADISKSYNCTLARQVRKRLKEFKIKKGFKVVFSPEHIDHSKVKVVEGMTYKKSVIGTISYMPAIFGLNCASVVIRDLVERD
ncbi:tRNA threonylcarbamoyladenosine dehydratase [Limibacter armeniacum]|uniref:tRNA threonylcarbamoyladenosine dehydratase n=1 Tax=Limibacter armeniacum TaxID=466084 RepID=UPI002FE685EE